MSYLQSERRSKKEFVHNIVNKISCESTLIFEKIHEYESYLTMLPKVLVSIVMSYVNNAYVVNYELKNKDDETLHGTIIFDYMKKWYGLELTFRYNHIYGSKWISYSDHEHPYYTICSLNSFMRDHYGKKLYLPNHSYYHNRIRNDCNYKLLKHEIIMMRKIMNTLFCITKSKK